MGVALTNLPYDRFSKHNGNSPSRSVVFSFLQRVEALDFSKPNVLETIEGEALCRNQFVLRTSPNGRHSGHFCECNHRSCFKLLNNYEAMEAVNNGADVMNQAKTGSESTVQLILQHLRAKPIRDDFHVRPLMIDLPTLYAMAEEAVGQEATRFRQKLFPPRRTSNSRSSKTSRNQSNATGRTTTPNQEQNGNQQSIQTSTAALQAQKADLMNVIDDILTIDGKLILDVQTGQFNAFVTETELKNAIRV